MQERRMLTVLSLLALVVVLATPALATEWVEPDYVEEPRFMEVTPVSSASSGSSSIGGAPPPGFGMMGFPGDILQGHGGFQQGLQFGNNFAPGFYWPPQTPYRFPAYPYDNPTYTPFPSKYPVPMPPPWRSDAFNVLSDGARYMQNMERYDFYPSGAAAVAPAATAVQTVAAVATS